MTGIVPLGGDLDLLIVTDTPPADEEFAEFRVDGVPVEIFKESGTRFAMLTAYTSPAAPPRPLTPGWAQQARQLAWQLQDDHSLSAAS